MQVVLMRLVEDFPPISEPEWGHLLIFAPGSYYYNYPQCLDEERTQELINVFLEAKFGAKADSDQDISPIGGEASTKKSFLIACYG